MRDNACAVVKVGGSLYDLPDLRDRLRAFLRTVDANRIVLVPGGGGAADVIRALDRAHRLGEEASHWLAIGALSLNARFLQVLLPEARIAHELFANASGSETLVLDALPFFLADDVRADHWPHTWEVSSDSLAVRAAVLLHAQQLILLKSVEWEGDDWLAGSRAGVVDGYFAAALAQGPADMRVGVVNLRS